MRRSSGVSLLLERYPCRHRQPQTDPSPIPAQACISSWCCFCFAILSLTRSSSSERISSAAGAGTALLSATPPSPSPAEDPGARGGGFCGVNHSSANWSSTEPPHLSAFASVFLELGSSPKAAKRGSSPPSVPFAAAGADELLLAFDPRRRAVVVVDDARRGRCLTLGMARGCPSTAACSRGRAKKAAASPAPPSAATPADPRRLSSSRRIGVLACAGAVLREIEGIKRDRPPAMREKTDDDCRDYRLNVIFELQRRSIRMHRVRPESRSLHIPAEAVAHILF